MSADRGVGRRWLRLLGLLVTEGAVLGLLLTLGTVLGAVRWDAIGPWLTGSDPTEILTALLRLGLIGLMAWMLLSTFLYGLAGQPEEGRLRVGRGWSSLAPHFLRRLIDGAAAVSVAVSAVAAASSSPASAASPGPVPSAPSAAARAPSDAKGAAPKAVEHPLAGRTPSRLPGPSGRHLPHPGLAEHNAPGALAGAAQLRGPGPAHLDLDPGSRIYVVQPGDCLSVIAERHLGDWRRDADIDRLNRGRPQPDGRALTDDHWIYPGWVLVMPDDAIDVQEVAAPVMPVSPAISPTPMVRPPAKSVAGSPEGSARPVPSSDSHIGLAERAHEDAPRSVQAAIGVLAAAAFGLAIQRRRREAMHDRPTGRRVRRSRPAVEEAELLARARASGVDDLMRRVDWGLRILGRELAEQTEDPAPSVVLVRAALDGIEVMVDPPSLSAPRHFEAVEGGTIWVLDPSLSAGDLETLAESSWPFLPALVSVGETPAGTVLVNLEHAGVLRLCGDPGAVRSALAEVALELRCQPWSVDAVARLIVDGVELAGPRETGPEVNSGPPSSEWGGNAAGVGLTRDIADAAIRSAVRCAEGVGSNSTAATLRAASFQWLPTAAICGPESQRELVDQLCEAALPGRSGLVVVVADDEEGSWQLRLEPGGEAVLRGVLDGASFTLPVERVADHGLVARLSAALDRPIGEPPPGPEDEYERPSQLLDLAGTLELPELDRWISEVEGEWEDDEVAGVDDIEGEEQVVAFRSHGMGDVSLTIDLVEEVTPESAVPASEEETDGQPEALGADRPQVELTILGPVGLTGSADLAAVPASRQASALAVIAFLATRHRPVTADEIAAALWPSDSAKDNFGEPRRKTVMNVISRARSLLGEPIVGPSRLLLTDRGYLLSPEVQCDWTRFERLIETEVGGPGEEAALLRSALELVKGPPLAGSLSSPFFEWVSAQHLDLAMEARVVDAAERLGVVALDLGDLTLAEWAVRKGLELDPAREELYRVWMHVAGRLGRPDQVDEVYRRLCRALQRHLDAGMAPSEASEAVRSSYSGRPVKV